MWNCDSWLGGGYPGTGSFFGHFGGIIGLLIFVVVIALIYKLFKSSSKGANATSDKHDSFAILKSRFARGEISLEEYQRLKEILLQP
jgi:putative membrane protein